MREIELKILEINVKEIEKRLKALGAKRVLNRVPFKEVILDFKTLPIRKASCMLRLRSEGRKNMLAFKYKTHDDGKFKESEETEVEVSDFIKMERILNRLGLKRDFVRSKVRTSYKLGKVRFEIDKYEKIPAYLELEGAKKEIIQSLKLLAIPFSATTNMNAGQVFRHYGFGPGGGPLTKKIK